MPTRRIRRLVLAALCIALFVAGAEIRIPGVVDTPALDSTAGHLAAMAFGPAFGAPVAPLVHIVTAMVAGFPLTQPVRLVKAVTTTGYAWRRFGPAVAVVWGVFFNGVVEPAIFNPVPGFGPAFFLTSVAQLLPASVLNGACAGALCLALARRGALGQSQRWLLG